MKILQNKFDDNRVIMSQMKFISDADRAVEDALVGLKCAYPALYVDKKNRIVLSNQISKNRVALLSGGGSGHEPFSIGFVGDGMLSGAVAGLVFASPPTRTISAAIRALAEQNGNSGVLVIVMNYTGDILNFGLALESARSENIDAEMVVISEDCSRINEEVQGAGRRGLCGNCFIFKIAGNMAKCGIKLSYIAAECRQINDFMSTLGATVSSCTVPGVGSLFSLGPDEVEIGLGVHGEIGTCRRKLCTIDELVNLMVSKIAQSLHLAAGSNVCVVINNLGSISHLELGIICNKVYNCLTESQITTCRLYSGSFMTSLDMAGFQISVLNITEHPEWLEHLDSNTSAPGWPSTCISIPIPMNENRIAIKNNNLELNKIGPKLSANEASLFEKCLCSIANVFIQKEEFLNKLDTFSGEGDIGSALRRFSECILQNMPKLDLEYPAVCFFHMSRLMQNIGGQSCTLYSILLASATRYLASTSKMDWLKMWKSSLDSLVCYSKAKIGDRTMVDVLVPVYDTFCNNITNKKEVLTAFEEAVNVGKINCEKTRFMKARASTSSAENEEESDEVECGAFATTLWLEAIHRTIHNYFFE
ncbi:PTS-dependent dihydroxyacetone kinase 1, dihydroxyacetone-binding subunit DhaK-like [Planococcus citri]|uniref:PTS-dependent dihydroxyacetone kinase 1, dihydroxyacetone-binding subunit DhaK-like n=1 Tax=Planococcus citri TaxID=170843 RepID=UPI0031F885E5